MRRAFLFCLFFLLFQACTKTGVQDDRLPSPFMIIPQPHSVELERGPGLVAGDLRQLVIKGSFKRPVMEEILSQLPIGEPDGRGLLTLILDTTMTSLPSKEGYILTVSHDGAEVIAAGESGIFYGCQTLEQLLEDARDFRLPVPACRITDFPSLSYRAVHFDVKHHLDHMNYYYALVDRLARYKVNAVIFEFEDKLRYRRQPPVGAPQAISIDEMAALTAYARDRHVEISPLVQGLGHATFILKHKEYTPLRELPWNKWAFCPLDEGTYKVLFDLYRDAIDATPGSRYLHIGGDEIGNIGLCPRCKPTADKEGTLSLSLYWLRRVCAFAEEHNRIPVFWDDMPLKYGGVYESTWDDDITEEEAEKAWEEGIPRLDSLLKEFPRNCVYMRWNYSMARQPGNIRALEWYRSRGLSTMVATASNAWESALFHHEEWDKGDASSGIATIRSFIQLAAEKNISGNLCTAWDDRSPHMESYLHGLIASAEYGWSPEGRTLDEFDEAWLQREFGISVPGYHELNAKLRRGTDLWEEAYYRKGGRFDDESSLQSLPRVEHWLPPLPDQEKVQFDYATKLIELPDPASPGSWGDRYRDRLDRAQVEADEYEELSGRLAGLYNASKRNSYFWELSLALYNLQSTAPEILLALKSCDTSNAKLRREGVDKLNASLSHFEERWDELTEVYEKTRFVSYPPDYIPDRYFHPASQREDLSFMIQAEELMFEMIGQWQEDK
jgi:hexosaminidase